MCISYRSLLSKEKLLNLLPSRLYWRPSPNPNRDRAARHLPICTKPSPKAMPDGAPTARPNRLQPYLGPRCTVPSSPENKRGQTWRVMVSYLFNSSCAPSELAQQLQSKLRQRIGALLLRWERTRYLPFCSHSPKRHQWPNWIKRSPNFTLLVRRGSRCQLCQSVLGP